jgi:hypothetical protein
MPTEEPNEPMPELDADIIRLASLKTKSKPDPKKLKREIDRSLKECAYELIEIQHRFGKATDKVLHQIKDPKQPKNLNSALVKEMKDLLTLAINKINVDRNYIRSDKKNMTEKQMDVGVALLNLIKAVIEMMRAYLSYVHTCQRVLNDEPVSDQLLNKHWRIIKTRIEKTRIEKRDLLMKEFGKRMKLMRADR